MSRGFLRLVRELAKRSAFGPYLADLGPQANNSYTKRVALDNAELATAAGLEIARSGGAVHCHGQTHAGFRGEIYFGEDRAPSDQLWQPLSRCQVSYPPDGESFKTFRVRVRTGSNLDATSEVVLIVDGAPYGSEALDAQPPTPEIGSGGSAFTRIRALLRSSGAEVDLETAAGAVATRGILGVAALGTDGTLRGIASGAAALADAAASAAGEILVGAKLQGFNGATWDRLRTAIGAAGVGVLRVVGVTTATAVVTRPTAGAATGVAVAANASRKAVMIRNTHATETAYVDTAAAAVATGVPIGPGASVTFTTVQAINCIRGAAADVALSVADESY